ncbi:MAG: hypothetical protein U1E37_00890 [Sphingomonadaceae bacterium]
MDTVLSILVLAAIAMILGAWALWRRGGSPMQIALMLVLALILIGNVAIWVMPDEAGQAPVSQQLK